MATFNIGKDRSVTIIVNGAPLSPKTVTSFSAKQESKVITSEPLNDAPARRKVPRGWSGGLSYDRGDSTLDNYFVLEERTYYAGADADQIQILETTVDPVTRNIAQFRYDNVVLEYEDGGDAKADDRIMQKVKWTAATKTPVQ